MEFKSEAIKKFYETNKDFGQIEHIVDFLNDKYPYKTQFNFTVEEALKKADAWVLSLNKRNKNSKSGKVKVIKYLGGGMSLVLLKDQEAKNWEGFHMKHCVASYKNHRGIYSIRDTKNIPHCTFEVGLKSIKQIKGKCNREVVDKYIPYCIESLKVLNKSIDSYDLDNLKLAAFSKSSFFRKYFTGYDIVIDRMFGDTVVTLDSLKLLKIKKSIKKPFFLFKKSKKHFDQQMIENLNIFIVNNAPIDCIQSLLSVVGPLTENTWMNSVYRSVKKQNFDSLKFFLSSRFDYVSHGLSLDNARDWRSVLNSTIENNDFESFKLLVDRISYLFKKPNDENFWRVENFLENVLLGELYYWKVDVKFLKYVYESAPSLFFEQHSFKSLTRSVNSEGMRFFFEKRM